MASRHQRLDKQQHRPPQHRCSSLFTDVAIGIGDGLIVPFALAAGLSGASLNTHLILVICLAVMAAGGIVMGLGGYLAGKTAEADEGRNNHMNMVYESGQPQQEPALTFLHQLVFDEEMQGQAANLSSTEKNEWKALGMETAQEPNEKARAGAAKIGFHIGLSYGIAGLIPISPYFFMRDAVAGLRISVIITLLCLYVFGTCKSVSIGLNPWWGGFRSVCAGAAAATCAFAVARLVQR